MLKKCCDLIVVGKEKMSRLESRSRGAAGFATDSNSSDDEFNAIRRASTRFFAPAP